MMSNHGVLFHDDDDGDDPDVVVGPDRQKPGTCPGLISTPLLLCFSISPLARHPSTIHTHTHHA